MAHWAAPLAHLPPGTPTAFLWNPRPPAVALDLAIQAAGLVSVPVTDLAKLKGARAWAGPGGTAGPEGLEHVSLPSWDSARAADLPDRPAGGVLVEGREVGQEELVAAAERMQESIGGEGREIVVAGRSPERWPDRVLFAWATLSGAALLLAPDPASLVASAIWARPTVFQGTPAELKALRLAVEQEKAPFWDRREDRLPFGRLRVVLCEELAEEERRFWEGRGVRTPGLPGVETPG